MASCTDPCTCQTEGLIHLCKCRAIFRFRRDLDFQSFQTSVLFQQQRKLAGGMGSSQYHTEKITNFWPGNFEKKISNFWPGNFEKKISNFWSRNVDKKYQSFGVEIKKKSNLFLM